MIHNHKTADARQDNPKDKDNCKTKTTTREYNDKTRQGKTRQGKTGKTRQDNRSTRHDKTIERQARQEQDTTRLSPFFSILIVCRDPRDTAKRRNRYGL